MKTVTLKYGVDSQDKFDMSNIFGSNVIFDGFDYFSIKQFGSFLAAMAGADKIIFEEYHDDGSGFSHVIDLVSGDEKVEDMDDNIVDEA